MLVNQFVVVMMIVEQEKFAKDLLVVPDAVRMLVVLITFLAFINTARILVTMPQPVALTQSVTQLTIKRSVPARMD